MNTDRCDGCGRFISIPAQIVQSYHWSADGAELDEYHYCVKCAAFPMSAPAAIKGA